VRFKKSPQKIPQTESSQKSNLNFAMKTESVDSGLEAESLVEKSAYYILIDSRDRINITLTPQSMQVIYDLVTHFTQKSLPVTDYQNVMGIADSNDPITLVNDIGELFYDASEIKTK
jgi:hypothetical protein